MSPTLHSGCNNRPHSLYVYVCVWCVCLCSHEYTWVYGCGYMCMGEEAKGQPAVLCLRHWPFVFWDPGCHWPGGLLSGLDGYPASPTESSCLFPQGCSHTGTPLCTSFYVGAGEPCFYGKHFSKCHSCRGGWSMRTSESVTHSFWLYRWLASDNNMPFFEPACSWSLSVLYFKEWQVTDIDFFYSKNLLWLLGDTQRPKNRNY